MVPYQLALQSLSMFTDTHAYFFMKKVCDKFLCVTLTSHKTCQDNNKCDCSKQTVLNEVYVFLNKISL